MFWQYWDRLSFSWVLNAIGKQASFYISLFWIITINMSEKVGIQVAKIVRISWFRFQFPFQRNRLKVEHRPTIPTQLEIFNSFLFGTQEQRSRLQILTECSRNLIKHQQGELPKLKDEDKEAFENFKTAVLKKYSEIPISKNVPKVFSLNKIKL